MKSKVKAEISPTEAFNMNALFFSWNSLTFLRWSYFSLLSCFPFSMHTGLPSLACKVLQSEEVPEGG
jgi:hypothetical protein